MVCASLVARVTMAEASRLMTLSDGWPFCEGGRNTHVGSEGNYIHLKYKSMCENLHAGCENWPEILLPQGG